MKDKASLNQKDNKEDNLKLGKNHRFITKPKKEKRQPSIKKKMRDIERLVQREGLPEEIVNAKKKELRTLRKELHKKKEAVLFQSRYKKIRFIEKKKILRRLNKEEGENALSE